MKTIKKVWKFVKCFYMTAYGIAVYSAISWFFYYAAGYALKFHIEYLFWLTAVAAGLSLLFVRAIYDGLKNDIYKYKNWEEFRF